MKRALYTGPIASLRRRSRVVMSQLQNSVVCDEEEEQEEASVGLESLCKDD